MEVRFMEDWKKELETLLGRGKFSTEMKILDAYSSDRWRESQRPEAVAFPENTLEAVGILRTCAKYQIPITPRGTGTGYVGGCVPLKKGVVLSTEKMTRIFEICPKDGIARVQPGVITGEFQKKVREKNMEYPPDPASLKECSIGGNVATNAGGPRCLKYGVTGRYILGLEIVLSSGEILTLGGKTHKNVTGLNVLPLFIGSEGTLGIITEITLALIPKIQERGVLTCFFQNFFQTLEAGEEVLSHGVLPSALEVADKLTLEATRKRLGEGVLPQGDGYLMLEVDGSENSVKEQIYRMRKILSEKGAKHIQIGLGEAEVEKVWKVRREFSYGLRDLNLVKINQDTTVPRSKIGKLYETIQAIEERFKIRIACFGHAGDGNLHVNLMMEKNRQEECSQAVDLLFQRVLQLGGALSGEHGIGIAKQPWIKMALNEKSCSIQNQIKQIFDPLGILNPGKFPGTDFQD